MEKYFNRSLFFLLLAILFSVGKAFSQYSASNIKAEIIGDNCQTSSGIIKLKSDVPFTSFIWPLNINNIDSIAYNLVAGDYQVTAKFPNNQNVILHLNVPSLIECLPNKAFQDFTINVVGDGIVKLKQLNSHADKVTWNMGDGNIIQDNNSEYVYKFSSSGLFNICMTVEGKLESRTFCQNLNLETFYNSISGFGLNLSNSQVPFNTREIVACGNKEYIIYDTQVNSTSVLKIAAKDPNLNNLITLPIDKFGGTSAKAICFKDKLYFSGVVGNSGEELCETDGTMTGTRIVEDFITPNTLNQLHPYIFFPDGDNLYMGAYPQIGAASTADFFVFNGQNIVKIPGMNNAIGQIVKSNNSIFVNSYGKIFKLENNSFAQINCANCLAGMLWSINNQLIYMVNNSSILSNNGIWKYDGSNNSSNILNNFNQRSSNNMSLIINDKIYFMVRPLGFTGQQLWVTDGTNQGTIKLKDIYQIQYEENFKKMEEINGIIYFLAKNSGISSLHELWKSDGTISGTTKVPNISLIDYRSEIFTFNNKLIFQGDVIQSFDPTNNRILNIEIACNNNYLLLNKAYISGGKFKIFAYSPYYNGTNIFEICEFLNAPMLTNQIFTNPNLTIYKPLNYDMNVYDFNPIFCTPLNNNSDYSFDGFIRNSFSVQLKSLTGCIVPKQKISYVRKTLPTLKIVGISRCDNQIFKLKISKSDDFPSITQFNLVFRIWNSNSVLSIPIQISQDVQSFSIPELFRNSDAYVTIFSSFMGIISNHENLPDLNMDKTTYFVGTKNLFPGQMAKLTFFSKGIPPFNYTLNNESFSTNLNIYQRIFIVNETQSYNLSLASDACGTKLVENPLVTFTPVTCQVWGATISGTQSINLGQTAQIKIDFTGYSPWNYSINNDTIQTSRVSPLFLSVSPTQDTNYIITSLTNFCGAGSPLGAANISLLCQENFSQFSTISGSKNIKVSNKIIGNNFIEEFSSVHFDAKKSVILLPGFNAKLGSIFKASAGGGCDN